MTVRLLNLQMQLSELIETLWNVNIAKFVMIVTPVARINRNIVECKCDKNGLGIASGTTN